MKGEGTALPEGQHGKDRGGGVCVEVLGVAASGTQLLVRGCCRVRGGMSWRMAGWRSEAGQTERVA